MHCEHKFGIKTRPSGEKYCPVCRKTMYGFSGMIADWGTTGEGVRQGRSKTIKPNGWR